MDLVKVEEVRTVGGKGGSGRKGERELNLMDREVDLVGGKRGQSSKYGWPNYYKKVTLSEYLAGIRPRVYSDDPSQQFTQLDGLNRVGYSD